ncbi:hypothetical protein C2G38_2165080 [Gigaspora rosea]|uniref:Uncharacterized protein n=1 Tax=Gigaspora rosea TaxID=44941 RepID=A0A397VTE7_9GLOM|nr:hypothetical protein C2G38_2165080 [Gigaspora rosea]
MTQLSCRTIPSYHSNYNATATAYPNNQEWHYENILEAFTNEEKMCDFVKHKLENKPTTHAIPPAIATKFKYLDREFFRTFTRNKRIMPAHQKEFDEIFNLAIANYKGKHNVTNEKETTINSSSTKLLHGFYENRKRIFVPLERLSEDPAELKYNLGKLFPVKDRKKLKEVIEMKRCLAEYYTWDGKLPESYFDLPEKKRPLPTTPQELSSRFREFFPIDLAKNTIEATKFIEEAGLRYSISYPIPREIMTANPTDKPTLPLDHNEIKEFNLTVLIAMTKQLVETVRLLRTKYYFHRIPEEWIQIVKVAKNGNEERKDTEIAEDTQNQAIRVDMPESLEEVKLYLEQLEITEDTIKIPITKQSEVKSTIEELKKIFDVGKVPNFIFALPPLPKPTWDIIP